MKKLREPNGSQPWVEPLKCDYRWYPDFPCTGKLHWVKRLWVKQGEPTPVGGITLCTAHLAKEERSALDNDNFEIEWEVLPDEEVAQGKRKPQGH